MSTELGIKKAIVTGAAGFAGYSLTSHLLAHGYEVYAVVRPKSAHNDRLLPENIEKTLKLDIEKGSLESAIVQSNIERYDIEKRLHIVELDSSDYGELDNRINDKCDVMFHLTWAGGRDNFDEQFKNISDTIKVLDEAVKLGCKRFVCTGSQAEYGIKEGSITEDLNPEPINAYGAAKVAAMYLTKRKAEQLGIDWIWGRIFSLYGLYEPSGRMLPDLIRKLSNGETVQLSDCSQNWDYLDAGDAAECIIALGERGHSGEIYNIANGDYKPLKKFVEIMEQQFSKGGQVIYGKKADPFVTLEPSVDKTMQHTNWKARLEFLYKYKYDNE